ncbi:hypothetical protein GCM10010833_25200 [Blastomonas aquatica]|uniref:Uncharacterized protein n=1 Tax=Blastomonas aquatica TaxID=1510276 RepID=A0ABQ1JL04_9SPHN|nr:hypothetical protein GCM10010833_25200 [Blastomonas aquatica]
MLNFAPPGMLAQGAFQALDTLMDPQRQKAVAANGGQLGGIDACAMVTAYPMGPKPVGHHLRENPLIRMRQHDVCCVLDEFRLCGPDDLGHVAWEIGA